MNIIDLIKADHRHVESLFQQYGAESDGPTKHDILSAIIRELKLHAAMEEAIVYPVVAKVDPAEAEHAQEEHDAIMEAMLTIDSSPQPTHAALTARLQGEVEHHVSEEESDDGLLEKLGRSGSDLEAMGTEAEEFKNGRP